jgi:hypothetical protein
LTSAAAERQYVVGHPKTVLLETEVEEHRVHTPLNRQSTLQKEDVTCMLLEKLRNPDPPG